MGEASALGFALYRYASESYITSGHERGCTPHTWPPCTRYAQRSKEARLEWSSFTKEYFLKRETLANVLLLVDSSVPVQVPRHKWPSHAYYLPYCQSLPACSERSSGLDTSVVPALLCRRQTWSAPGGWQMRRCPSRWSSPKPTSARSAAPRHATT